MKTCYLLLCLLLMTNCGVFKKIHKDSSKAHDSKVETVESSKIVTEQYGDIVTGNFPLPPLTQEPYHVPIESTGIKLDLYIQDGKVTYRAEAKPTAKTSTEDARSHMATEHKTETANKSRDVEKKTLIPWWIWAVAALAVVGYVLYRYTGTSTYISSFVTVIKNLLKPNKNG